MFNIDYRQSKHMKEVKKDHLEKIEKEPKDNEKTYIDEYRELITNIIDRRLTFEENTNNNKQN